MPPTDNERLDLVQLKVERANKHIRDLQLALAAFFLSNPYKVAGQVDPQTRRILYVIEHVKPVPKEVAMITGDALQNLRSALDHLANQLVIAYGNTPGPSTCFPIEKGPEEYKTSAPGKIKGMSPEAKNAISAVKPYKGGNDTLWRLHKLNIADKHRFLITVGSAYRNFDITSYIQKHFRNFPGGEFQMPPILLKPKNRQFPLKQGNVVFSDVPGSEINNDLKFTFEVALHEPGVVEGESLLATVQGMADLISNLISDFAPLLR